MVSGASRTAECRHTPNSDSHVSDGALRFDNLSGDASASRLPPPPPPSWGFGAATSPATDLAHRMVTPQPHPDRASATAAAALSSHGAPLCASPDAPECHDPCPPTGNLPSAVDPSSPYRQVGFPPPP
ncbi:hypothetical protein AB1Y20_006400 [Prymnesium parvum]|uniref:Uncharacterized protein n=1 Tax=Prymnesium parvum TaxID=97485 RepID=A0AB34J344_PRYPA